jgi:3-methyladenine DNA glycosylase AlkC
MNSWEQQFHHYVLHDDIDSAIAILTNLAGVTKTIPISDKVKALKIIEKHLSDLKHARRWLYHMLGSHSPSARDLGALFASNLIPSLYQQNPQEVRAILARIADDPHWEVRETTSYVFLELVKVDLDEAFSLLKHWVTHPSENLRRAVALTVKKVGKERQPEWGEILLDIIEPLLSDRSVYVRKNLGPFAIGDGMLRYYPKLTLERLQRWSTCKNEQVRWNVAMVFSAAEGAKHLEKAIPILARLARDEHRYVWRAVASAMRNLGRRSPEKVVPVLKNWLEDPLQSRPAQVAIEYI